MTRRMHGALRWALWGLFNFLVIKGAVLPPGRIPRIFQYLNDKLVHGAEFFVLFCFTLLAFSTVTLRTRAEKLALAYCALLGGVTELLQLNVRGRSCDWKDFGVDLLGAGLAFGLWRLAASRTKNEVL